MVAFYKHDIAAWRGGTASLTHEQYRVYHVLVEQMMLEEGSVLVHERMLAGLSGMSMRAFRSVLDQLIQLGKVKRNGDRVSNGRAETELLSVRENRENARLGGVSSGVQRKKGQAFAVKRPPTTRETHKNASKINGDGEAPLLRHANIREKRREDTLEADASNGAEAPPDLSAPERDLFIRGREVLGSDAGGLIAKLLRSKGRNVALARADIERASQADIPREFIGRVLAPTPFPRRQESSHVPSTRGSAAQLLRAQLEADLLRQPEGEGIRPEPLRLLSQH